MDTGNKIKHFRLLKGFSQEKMAELLGIAPKSYGNIERNITDINFSRLQQIANVLEVSLPKLLDFDEKNIIHGNNNSLNNPLNSPNSNIYSDQSLAHQLDTARQEISFLKKENTLLASENGNLKEIIALMKEKK